MGLVRIEPQPRCGRPVRIAFSNRGPEYWYNERVAWRHGNGNQMLFEWKCPLGVNGEPVLVDGVWYWKEAR